MEDIHTCAFFLYLAPTAKPSNLHPQILETFVEIRWGPVPEESRNGKILGYYVTYYRADNASYKHTEKKQPDFFSLQLKSLDQFSRYNVTVFAFTRAGNGPVANITFKTSDDGKYQNKNSPNCVSHIFRNS